jgi:hypothetical protein
VRIEWSPRALATAGRFMRDQDGMRDISAAVTALADDPYPPGSFPGGAGTGGCASALTG